MGVGVGVKVRVAVGALVGAAVTVLTGATVDVVATGAQLDRKMAKSKTTKILR
jgi:hypothetical protein